MIYALVGLYILGGMMCLVWIDDEFGIRRTYAHRVFLVIAFWPVIPMACLVALGWRGLLRSMRDI